MRLANGRGKIKKGTGSKNTSTETANVKGVTCEKGSEEAVHTRARSALSSVDLPSPWWVAGATIEASTCRITT